MTFQMTSASEDERPEVKQYQIGQQTVIHAAAEDCNQAVKPRSVDILIFDTPAIDPEWEVEDYLDWLEDDVYPAIKPCMKKDAVVISIPRDRKGGPFSKGIATAAFLQTHGWTFFRQIVWERQEADFNRSKYAFGNIFFFRRGNRPSNADSPITYKDIIRVKDNPEGFVGEIPEEIYRLCLSRFYRSGDIIMDPFAGTGSLARMCQKAGYKSISVEIDKTEVQNILNRLQTGEKDGED